jgi:hypothetical protein
MLPSAGLWVRVIHIYLRDDFSTEYSCSLKIRVRSGAINMLCRPPPYKRILPVNEPHHDTRNGPGVSHGLRILGLR